MYEEAFNAAGGVLLTLLNNLPYLLAGIAVGIMVGILPGLGGTVGMSVLLPFIFGVEQEAGIALLIGMVAIIHTADTFPSVLLGVPGSSGSQATILDGYPLARKGQASRALSAAFSASLIGGLVGAVVLFFILPVGPEILAWIQSPERLMIALLGVSMVGVLAGNRPVRGVIMGFVGLGLGAVGFAPAAPEPRYTFGLLYLNDGFKLALVALGIFALPEVLDLLAKRTRIASDGRSGLGSGWLRGIKDTLRSWFLVLRSSVLGTMVGFIPGLGGSVVDWVSYGLAKSTLRKTENFGKGDIRGVIAPESANNAKEGGALIPTILFGIPGSGATAVLLGGFFLLGLQPGPTFITTNLDTVLLIVWSLAAANVFGTMLTIGIAPVAAWIASVNIARIAPFLLVVMVIGAYQTTRNWGDIWAFLIIGLVAWLLRKMRFPMVPLLIGFVLSTTIERQLWLSTQLNGANWLLDPSVLALTAVIVVLVGASLWLQREATTNA